VSDLTSIPTTYRSGGAGGRENDVVADGPPRTPCWTCGAAIGDGEGWLWEIADRESPGGAKEVWFCDDCFCV
jgi:hypothetical protein